MTAYQITSIMEGVIQRGTATVVREVGKPVAGKTGTTNDEKDAWFVGFTPDLVIGVYIGYDKPRHLGRNATGGHLSAPIAKDFLKAALADKPAMPFKVPPGIKLIRVDVKTGQRATPRTPERDPRSLQARHGAARLGRAREHGRQRGRRERRHRSRRARRGHRRVVLTRSARGRPNRGCAVASRQARYIPLRDRFSGTFLA